mmetsp:Transcript_70771/g.133695  ORF Transcript_70771/g.133695 Transcript_70771/m.133695 type:complete len:189 (-) Transcript_70771:102-668(-)
MGSLASRLEEKQREAVLMQRVADLRQQKIVRDTTQSMTIASVRDRILWITAYYSTVGLLSGLRHVAMHRRGVHFTFDNFFLPLNAVFVCIPPFALGYQVDFAYFDKANRLAAEAAKIRAGEPHHWFGNAWLPVARHDADFWFNQPMVLPANLQPAYKKFMDQVNRDQAEVGQPLYKDWATFTAPPASK